MILNAAISNNPPSLMSFGMVAIPKDWKVKTCTVFHLPSWQNPNVFCHVAPVLMNRRRRIGRADTPDDGNSKRLKREPYPFQTLRRNTSRQSSDF